MKQLIMLFTALAVGCSSNKEQNIADDVVVIADTSYQGVSVVKFAAVEGGIVLDGSREYRF